LDTYSTEDKRERERERVRKGVGSVGVWGLPAVDTNVGSTTSRVNLESGEGANLEPKKE
jgi:hypothetical protein